LKEDKLKFTYNVETLGCTACPNLPFIAAYLCLSINPANDFLIASFSLLLSVLYICSIHSHSSLLGNNFSLFSLYWFEFYSQQIKVLCESL
jgi:hypothetical protein